MSKSRRAALITGSNKNIGRACALALARDGCNVVVNGSQGSQRGGSVAKEVRALGVEAMVAMGDVGKREDCMRIAKEGIDAFGTIDILVNNAAIREDGGFLELSEDAVAPRHGYQLRRVLLAVARLPARHDR